ncbi:uncharacterized protein LOC131047044 [Cryptomeria japonica]|uniref:uncharacterized protein LOC131047044 n=1 Tax=Cryptomeria japonica TaxID=3369 RepID=UPI0027DA5B41|nr:uncharacterized protein LOC131047044 [Cryptomeria japonica]
MAVVDLLRFAVRAGKNCVCTNGEIEDTEEAFQNPERQIAEIDEDLVKRGMKPSEKVKRCIKRKERKKPQKQNECEGVIPYVWHRCKISRRLDECKSKIVRSLEKLGLPSLKEKKCKIIFSEQMAADIHAEERCIMVSPEESLCTAYIGVDIWPNNSPMTLMQALASHGCKRNRRFFMVRAKILEIVICSTALLSRIAFSCK